MRRLLALPHLPASLAALPLWLASLLGPPGPPGCLGGRSVHAEPPPPLVQGHLAASLDHFLILAADSGFAGAVLVAQDGRVILHEGYGWSDAARTRPVTTVTPFWIASVSKQFAAAALLKQVEQGALSVDDPIARYFPQVPADKQGITIHQLLTHTAGLAQNYAADGVVERYRAVQAVLAQPLARAPGSGFGYSNDAYNLIAALVEAVSGEPYETFLRRALLEPASLTHTGFWGPHEHPEVAAIHSVGFADSAFVRPNWGCRGGTGMFSTAGDLYQWSQALEQKRVLSAASLQRLWTAHVARGDTGVGYGWFVSRTPRGTKSLWTRGYEGFGHGAVLALYPEESVVIVVTSSSGEREGSPVSHTLARELEARVFAPR